MTIYTLEQIAKKLGISLRTLKYRIAAGYEIPGAVRRLDGIVVGYAVNAVDAFLNGK